MKTLGEFKRRINEVNIKLAYEINNKRWPLVNLSLKREVIVVLEDLQKSIAQLSLKDEQELALKYVEYFCFSLVVRVYAIDKIRSRKSRETAGIDTITIKSVRDFKTCLNLVKETHPMNVNYNENMEVKYIEILKKDVSKVRILGLSNIVDRVLQIQFHLLIDPLIDVNLPELFFGFRKGKNTHQALAYLSHSINVSDTSRFHLLYIDINKCFDTISHGYILEHFSFPEKYKKLLIRWLRGFRVCENSLRKERLDVGVSQGSVLGPVIANVILAKVFERFFDDTLFPRWFKSKTLAGKAKSFEINRYIIGYADDIILRLASKEEANHAKKKAEERLAVVGLRLNEEKVRLYDLSMKVKFDWLGYTFLIFPKDKVRYTKLIGRASRLMRQKQKVLPSSLLLYITNENFNKIKHKLKLIIGKLKNRDLYSVMKEANAILRGIAGYYSFANNIHRLDYLDHFVHKVYWRRLVEKFRFKGIRRPRWVAKTFFIVNKKLKDRAPSRNRVWQLHVQFPKQGSQFNARGPGYLWEVKASSYYRMQPMKIMSLAKETRKVSPYIDKEIFEANQIKVAKLRYNWLESSQFKRVFEKQKGLCVFCTEPIDLMGEEKIEIHHKIPLKFVTTKKERAEANRVVNTFALHYSCHRDLHRREKEAIDAGLLLKYTKVKKSVGTSTT